ncbi:conserved hypothetical transcriptional regulator [Shewanella halifaxensis HAW-EB4]|uniref:Conserved hypothetical transcriptional regulator n=1 Tax=Shewanella halifaxensis (strain HAW-EB4) TaxID=458817 RepID=B0TPF5_SHEHH|nr:conserved hypothetical transcriptional regulator [Shewanella halifaxensis HAW-EB4]
MAGFISISSFNTKFKELLKLTPKQYLSNHMDVRNSITTSSIVEAQV